MTGFRIQDSGFMFQVKIIPLTRLPRQLGIFDYSIPKDLEDKIKIGQLVKISFRQSEIFGLVLAFKHETTQNFTKNNAKEIKSIISIINEVPLTNETHLKFLLTLGEWYGVSIATLAKMSLLPLQKTKLKKLNLNQSKEEIHTKYTIQNTKYFYYKNDTEHKKIIRQTIKSTTLIIVPEVHHIDEVHQLLTIEQQQKSMVWHGGLTDKQKFERWMQIRNGNKTIILGTRTALLLPIPNLKSIVIDYEHHENHKSWDQAPRYQVRDVADLLAGLTDAKINLLSISPSCETYFHVAKGNYLVSNYQLSSNNTSTIIDLTNERRAGRFGLIAEEVKNEILKTKGNIFLYINRLGFSTSIGCNTCDYVAQCDKCLLPLVYRQKDNSLRCHYCKIQKRATFDCPKCRNKIVQLRGAGTEFVESGIRTMFGKDLNHEIIRIDSEVKEDLPYTKKPRIIIGTQMAFRHINWKKNKVTVFIDIDRELNLPEYRASENVWHKIQSVIYHHNGNFFIQTKNPDHLVFKSLREPERFYRTELNARRALGYPPYKYLLRYFYGNSDKKTCKTKVQFVYNNLTKSIKTARISEPLDMQPQFYRGKFWQVIIIKLDPKTWQKDLIELNKLIPTDWKIDPNPISLLSP
jgi:primosomal protein N'